MPEFHLTTHINASPDEVWAVLGDLTRVSEWIEGISQVQVDGMKRVCTFANGAVQHEEIGDYAPETHSYHYAIEGGPLPLKTNHGSFAVVPNDGGSLVTWETEVEATNPAAEAGIVAMLQPAYQQTLERLRQRVEENTSRRRETASDSDVQAVYQSLMDTLLEQPNIHVGKMFGAVGLKTGDKVFAMLVKDRLVVKLPKDRVGALIEAGDAIPFDPGHGRVMKEWVSLELRSRDEWLRLAEEAREFVAGMVR